MFSPENVAEFCKSPKGKYAIFDFISLHFQKLGLKEKVDGNEINIIAEFHYYNLEFAKEKLLLPDDKTALLMNIFAMLIAFKDYEVTIKTGSKKSEEQNAPKSEEEEYKASLEQKYEDLKETLLDFSIDNPPVSLRVFTEDEIKKILNYSMETYFQHFRLYSYVLSNKQLSDQKSISVYIDEPLPIPPLVEGLAGNTEREEFENKEDDEQENVKNDETEEKKLQEESKENASEEKKSEEAKKVESEAGLVSKTKNKKLDQDDHARLNAKLGTIKSELEAKINAREKVLDQMIEEKKGIK